MWHVAAYSRLDRKVMSTANFKAPNSPASPTCGLYPNLLVLYPKFDGALQYVS
jgi:hypothetical protein